jgi:hypothetical protein
VGGELGAERCSLDPPRTLVHYISRMYGVTPTPNKLLPTGDISHSLAGVELSSTNSLPDTTVSQLDRHTNFSFAPLSIN